MVRRQIRAWDEAPNTTLDGALATIDAIRGVFADVDAEEAAERERIAIIQRDLDR